MQKINRAVLIFAVVAGLALLVIGVRFVIWPEQAARFFGLQPRPAGTELHLVIGLRDLWLGALVLGFALCRQWRALMLWFGLGAIVCFGDAAVVLASTGKAHAIGFHVISGLACVLLTIACWQLARVTDRG